MTADITALDHLVVVNLDIHIWTARKKLVPLDLGGAELPPQDLASLGSKRICNPEDLRNFGTLKARSVNLLERNGIRFLSGWAVPDTRINDIMAELAVIRDEFNAAKEAFLQRYDQSVQDWIAKHPQWGNIIAGSTVSEEYVRSRIDFRWQVFQVAQPGAVAPAQSLDNLTDDIRQLGMTLFDEIAKAAGEAWHRCYAGKLDDIAIGIGVTSFDADLYPVLAAQDGCQQRQGFDDMLVIHGFLQKKRPPGRVSRRS